LQWDATNARPSDDFLKFTTWPVESHWTNFLAKNDSLQPQATQAWINYLDKVQATPGLYLARNTEQLHSQWLYKKYASINRLEEGKYLIDNTNMPDIVYENKLLGNLVFIVNTGQGEKISHASLDGSPLLLRYKSHGKSFLYLPPLGKKQYILEIKTGPGLPEVYIDYIGTYNIYNTKLSPDNLEFDIKMYGSQKIDIHCPLPDTVISNNPFLEITDYYYNVNDGILTITLSGRDMQGESGRVIVGRF